MQRKRHRVYVHHETDRRRWRVITLAPGGKRASRCFATEGPARRFARDVERAFETSDVCIQDVIDRYRGHLEDSELRVTTIATAVTRLESFFATMLDLDTWAVTQERAEELYRAYRSTPGRSGRIPSAATHRGVLAQAGRLYDWAVKQGYAEVNPFKEVEGVGRRRRGKKQLRASEAAKFWAKSLELAAAGDLGALAAAMALGLGMRAGEIAGVMGRDVDGDILIVERSAPNTEATKTEAGRRRLDVPAELLAPLQAACRSAGEALIFGGKDRHWVGYHVRRLCRLAKVPEVPPHGLRGTAATLAAQTGQLGPAVAMALGQASEQVTKDHYLAPGTLERAAAQRTLDTLRVRSPGVPLDNCEEEKDPTEVQLDGVQDSKTIS